MAKPIEYTWCYDKQGNKKKVYPPITADGKVVKDTGGTYVNGKKIKS